MLSSSDPFDCKTRADEISSHLKFIPQSKPPTTFALLIIVSEEPSITSITGYTTNIERTQRARARGREKRREKYSEIANLLISQDIIINTQIYRIRGNYEVSTKSDLTNSLKQLNDYLKIQALGPCKHKYKYSNIFM